MFIRRLIHPKIRLVLASTAIFASMSLGLYAEEATAEELNVAAKQVREWGGKVPGETLEQGESLDHIKLTFRQPENPQKRSEIGIVKYSDIPIFTKATLEVCSSIDGDFRIRVADNSDNPFIVTTPISAGVWTPVEFVIQKDSGKSWPPLTPYKALAFLVSTKDGENEQILEIKNIRLSGGAPAP